MGKMNDSMALEIADNWEQMAETEANSSPQRRATLRECADLLRMLADLGPPASPADPVRPALAEAMRKLTRKLNRVHPTNRRSDLPIMMHLYYGDLAAICAALSHKDS